MRNRAARQHQQDTVEIRHVRAMASQYDVPLIYPQDLDVVGEKPTLLKAFELACCQGPVSTVQSTITPSPRTPAFLHQGLVLALKAGNIDTATLLLTEGAPIVRNTADNIPRAPVAKQIPLFELLLIHGWTCNAPGYYGSTLLPRIVENVPLLRWFLEHDADPNLGPQWTLPPLLRLLRAMRVSKACNCCWTQVHVFSTVHHYNLRLGRARRAQTGM